MKKTRSIKQNAMLDTLPNFRNLGVTLRILLICNVMALCQVVFLSSNWDAVVRDMAQMAILFAPILLCCLSLISLLQPSLKKCTYWWGVFWVHGLVALVIVVVTILLRSLYAPIVQMDVSIFELFRFVLFGLMVCAVTLTYFRLRTRLLSHALNEARLQMLRARIRPHFFFNCINAVLGIVRAQPKRAETALEDMADLFRMAMSDAKDFVPLQQEVQLCKQYIALEQLRMGDRLQVNWNVQDVPDDTVIPPLLLQPLLENAVYHGIEPLMQGGSININILCKANVLDVVVENPCTVREHNAHAGNKMALQNIRERLELLFDADASYQVQSGKDFYRVEIILPYLKESNL